MTTGAISRANLQSNRQHQQTNTQFLQAGCSSCRPTNSVRALKGKVCCLLTSLIPASVSSSNSRCVPSRRSSNRSVMLGRPESADSRLFIHLVNVFFCTICWLSAAATHTHKHTHTRSQCLTTHSIHRLTLHRFYFSVPYTL